MPFKLAISYFALMLLSTPAFAQDDVQSKPIELAAIKAWVGVWNAEIEVWPQGLDAKSIKFKGVETVRAFGEYWLASDFDSEYSGQTTKVHSIVGYDLDKKQLVGTIIDHGPYAATMAGKYDHKSKTVHWTTTAKAPNGTKIVQKTSMTEKDADHRTLELSTPGTEKGKFNKFMVIQFTRQK